MQISALFVMHNSHWNIGNKVYTRRIRNNYYNAAIHFTGLTAITGGVPASDCPLLVSGTAAADSSANEGSAGGTTAVPGPTVPAANNEAIQELEVLLASARFTSNEH